MAGMVQNTNILYRGRGGGEVSLILLYFVFEWGLLQRFPVHQFYLPVNIDPSVEITSACNSSF
uniref:Uncharacterized protein n=1 Tax=Rhizophora mucronata TaxID=61149 RepID=A0A2P2JH98_RHIMU